MDRSKDECICGSRRHKSKWINCDRCRQWFHLVCARVTEDDLDKIVKFCCYMCTKRDGGMLTIFRCHACAGCWRQHDCGCCVSCLADPKKKCDKRHCALEKNDPYAHLVHNHSERKTTLTSKESTPVKTKRPYKKRGRKPKAEEATRVAKGSISLSNYGRSPNASRKAKEAIEGTRPYYIEDMTESSGSSEEEISKKKKRKTAPATKIILKVPKEEPLTPPPEVVPRVYKKRGRKPKSESQKLAESTLPSSSNTPPLLSTPSQSPPFLVPSLPSTSESKALEPPILSPAIILKQMKKCNGCDRNARKNSDYCSNRCWFKKETGQITTSKIILESHLRSGNVQCRTGISNPPLSSVKPIAPKAPFVVKKIASNNNQSKAAKSISSSSSTLSKPLSGMSALKI